MGRYEGAYLFLTIGVSCGRVLVVESGGCDLKGGVHGTG